MPQPLGEREAQQMGVGRAVGVGLHLADGLFQPGPVAGVAAVDVEGCRGHGARSLLGCAHAHLSSPPTLLFAGHDIPLSSTNDDGGPAEETLVDNGSNRPHADTVGG